jgi:hypothetical protein
MDNKFLCVILLILFLLLIIVIINKYDMMKYNNTLYNNTLYNNTLNIENFADTPSLNLWTTTPEQQAAQTTDLNDVQKKTVTNMITSISTDTLKSLIATQSPLLTGPQGPPGSQGPSGTSLIASGRLVNKNGSYDVTNNPNTNYFNPRYIVSRSEGTNPTASLSFMDEVSPFASFQNWSLDINNNVKNRYDDTCLTMNITQDKLYMDKCNNNNTNQKWNWDSTNRIISTSASTDRMLKCIGLTKPESNVATTNIPGCKGSTCLSNTPRRFMVVKDCDINNVNEDEVWSFV